MNIVHNESHCGQEKFFKKIQRLFVGVSRKDCRDIVKNCQACMSFNPLKTKGSVIPLVFNSPWEHVQADCIDLRKYKEYNDDYSWILTVIDCYSKFAFGYKLKQKSMIEVLDSFKILFYKEGMPKTLHTDNGKEVKNGELKMYCCLNSIKMVHGRVRHPQTQGAIERFNQTLCNRLATQLSHENNKKWIDILEKTIFEYNNEWHRAIDNFPFLIFRGRNGKNDIDFNHSDKISERDDYESNFGLEDVPSNEISDLLSNTHDTDDI